jgi:hypothetical protein
MIRVLAAFSVLFLAGCVTATANFAPARMNETFVNRTPPDKIELFRSQMPSRKYTEIGAVSACCNIGTNHLVELLRAKASEVGGDAIIGLEIDATGSASASVIRYQ